MSLVSARRSLSALGPAVEAASTRRLLQTTPSLMCDTGKGNATDQPCPVT
jgi:hypothetical protein